MTDFVGLARAADPDSISSDPAAKEQALESNVPSSGARCMGETAFPPLQNTNIQAPSQEIPTQAPLQGYPQQHLPQGMPMHAEELPEALRHHYQQQPCDVHNQPAAVPYQQQPIVGNPGSRPASSNAPDSPQASQVSSSFFYFDI